IRRTPFGANLKIGIPVTDRCSPEWRHQLVHRACDRVSSEIRITGRHRLRQIASACYRIGKPSVQPYTGGEIRRLVKGENITARTEESDFNPGNAIRPPRVTGRREEPSAGLIGRARSAAEDLVYARHIVRAVIGGAPFLEIKCA